MKKAFLIVAVAAAMLAIGFTDCKPNSPNSPETPSNPPNPPEPPELPKEIDIFVAGCDQSAANFVAKVWKNGKDLYDLTDGSKQAEARSVFVVGGDVYSAGYEGKVAKLWKNKTVTNLTDGSKNAFARSVFVAGSNIYTAGYEIKGMKYVAKVWKNGSELFALTDGSKNADAYSVFVVGEDVYTAGSAHNGTK